MKEILDSIISKIERPFCSEADFQHTLAWELKSMDIFKDAQILLEYPVEIDKKMIYHDIYIKKDNEVYLIELKYKTKTDTVTTHNALEFKLKKHGAYNRNCCLFWLDVKRLEDTPIKYTSCYCIMLTNDEWYLKDHKKYQEEVLYKIFSIHDKRKYRAGEKFIISAENQKSWLKGTDNLQSKGLENNYICKWRECVGLGKQWQYLLLEIKPA